jgi:hypothetical protein
MDYFLIYDCVKLSIKTTIAVLGMGEKRSGRYIFKPETIE